MKLSTILILTFVALTFVGVVFISLILNYNFNSLLAKTVYSNLESTSERIKVNLNSFIDGQLNKVELIATQSELTNEELQALVKIDSSFSSLLVIDSKGNVIASSINSEIGQDKSNDAFFINGLNHSYIKPIYHSSTGLYTFAVSAPFHGGVLVGRTNLDFFDTITNDYTGLGQTGESLLSFFNEKGEVVYFSERRFSGQKFEVLSKEEALNRPIYRSLLGEELVSSGLKDYRNVLVIYSTRYIDRLKLGMVVKIDEAEAIGLAKSEILKSSILASIALILIFIVLALFVSSKLVRPINKLKNEVDEITKGKLDIQLEKSKITEIQNLTDSLNRVLASMKLAVLRTGLPKEDLGLGEVIKAKEDIEMKFEIVAENSRQLLYDYDTEKGAIEWSGAVKDVTGYTSEEFNKFGIKQWEKLIHPKDRKQATLELVKAQKSGKKYHVIYRLKNKKGEYVMIEDEGLFLDKRMLGTMKLVSQDNYKKI